jgi:hypothetical protein
MTANFTRWTPEDAQVFTIDLVRGMNGARLGPFEQEVEVPQHAEWARFANHFGTASKAFFITADSPRYDFDRTAPLEFVFVDGSHEFEHVQSDSRKAYEALAPGGWLVWHDFGSKVPWVKAREAVGKCAFEEGAIHVEGTEVAFLRKGSGRVRQQDAPGEAGREDWCVVEDSTHPTRDHDRNPDPDLALALAPVLDPPPHGCERASRSANATVLHTARLLQALLLIRVPSVFHQWFRSSL